MMDQIPGLLLLQGTFSPALDRLKARSVKRIIINEQIHLRTPYQLLPDVAKEKVIGARRRLEGAVRVSISCC